MKQTNVYFTSELVGEQGFFFFFFTVDEYAPFFKTCLYMIS